MRDWVPGARWGDGVLEREVFFFPAGSCDVYGSFAAPATERPLFGVVVCPGWGVEGGSGSRIVRGIAAGVVAAGGATLVFDYPGAGDSWGELTSATMDDLEGAAVSAVAQAERRLPDTRWTLVGVTLGAAVAARAAVRTGVDRLLLVQPSLAVFDYFDELIRGARRARLGDPGAASQVFGYPVLDWVRDRSGDVAAGDPLAGFAGEGAIVSYAGSAPEGDASGLEPIVVAGTWRRGEQDQPELVAAATGWLAGELVDVS